MSIHQLASGNSSIMSFLFHDDGSGTEGGVALESADFSSALHHLLGEYETEAAVTLPGTAAAAETPELAIATNTATAVVLPAGLPLQALAGLVHPLGDDPEIMAADFEIPAPNSNAEPPPVLTGAMSTTDYGTPHKVLAAPASDTVSVAPAFSRGLNHLIELVRDAARIAPQPGGRGLQMDGAQGQPEALGTSVAHGETPTATSPNKDAGNARPHTTQQAPLAEGDQLFSARNVLFAENDAPTPNQDEQPEGGNLQPVSGKSLPPEVRAPGKFQADPPQMHRALLAEAGPLPGSAPQAPLRNLALPATATRADGRVQLQAGRKAVQNFRSAVTGTQRLSANDGDAKAASSPAMAFAMIEKAPQPEALPLDAQTTALTPTAANIQAQSMHGQSHAAPPHAVLQKAAGPESAGTTFANPQLYSPHTMGTEAWMQDLGTRVEWLQNMKVSTAELQLHPAELGALEIRIETENDTTTVSFVTNNTAARDIIEDTLPRLRELLANQGMQLGQSHVSQQSAEGQRRGQDAGKARHMLQGDAGAAGEAAPIRRTSYLADPSRIDHYV